MGLKVFELTNRIYDQLPVCGLVDDAIYCAHGGLPKSAKTVEQIVEVKRDLRDPEKESNIAWEILWSDPANEQEFVDTCEQKAVDPKTSGGFVFNTKRGTAFKFNEAGADSFLKANGLTHIVRAHEVAPVSVFLPVKKLRFIMFFILLQPGYVFHFINKCVTIFRFDLYICKLGKLTLKLVAFVCSTSHYCGNNNLCGFILADNQRLRVIHMDTAANGSATDWGSGLHSCTLTFHLRSFCTLLTLSHFLACFTFTFIVTNNFNFIIKIIKATVLLFKLL